MMCLRGYQNQCRATLTVGLPIEYVEMFRVQGQGWSIGTNGNEWKSMHSPNKDGNTNACVFIISSKISY